MPAHVYVCPCGHGDRNITKYTQHANSRSCDFTIADMKRIPLSDFEEKKREKATSRVVCPDLQTNNQSEIAQEVAQLRDIIASLVSKIDSLSSDISRQSPGSTRQRGTKTIHDSKGVATTDPHVLACKKVLTATWSTRYNILNASPHIAPSFFYKVVYSNPEVYADMAATMNGLDNVEKISKCIEDFIGVLEESEGVEARVLATVLRAAYCDEKSLFGAKFKKLEINGESPSTKEAKEMERISLQYQTSCLTKDRIIQGFGFAS